MKEKKKMRTPVLMLMLFSIGWMGSLFAQDAKKTATETAIRNLVDSQRYVFYAQTAVPTGGSQRFLTTEYSVKVSPDTVTSDLPYFGRAYSAPTNPTDGGIQFTSTDFEYKITPAKKGGWDVVIRPKDAKDIQQLLLTIYDNGKANLRVNSNSRQSILFYGIVTAIKPKKKS